MRGESKTSRGTDPNPLRVTRYFAGEEQDAEKHLFAKGPAPAKGENGKWGFLAPNGSWAVEAKFIEVKPFQGDLAAAREKEKWGYIDATGSWKIPPRFTWAGEFSENLAPLRRRSFNGKVWIY